MQTDTHCGNLAATWNERAEKFFATQQKEASTITEAVTKRLIDRGLLEEKTVLDIGGGTGRYAIPFAVHAAHITVVDIADQMLKYARIGAKEAGHDNLEYMTLDWTTADPETLGWKHKFDLVFASMCPAVRTPEGLSKMCYVSGGWCQINQFIENTDTIAQHLQRDLAVSQIFDPHNDRAAGEQIFKQLWATGYTPEIQYLRQTENESISVDEAERRYGRRFGSAAVERGISLRQLLKQYAEVDSISVSRKTTLALILWQVSE